MRRPRVVPVPVVEVVVGICCIAELFAYQIFFYFFTIFPWKRRESQNPHGRKKKPKKKKRFPG